jgi:hypothetical protein
VTLRVLGFVACSLACVVGLWVAILPILEARYSHLAGTPGYDRALAEIRKAVEESVPTPVATGKLLPLVPLDAIQAPQEGGAPQGIWADEPHTDGQLPDGTTLRFRGQLTPDELASKINAYLKVLSHFDPAPGAAVAPMTMVQIPWDAQRWLRPPLLTAPEDTFLFSVNESEAAILSDFKTKYLLPRSADSITAAIASNRMAFFAGVALFGLGLIGFGGMLWRRRGAN